MNLFHYFFPKALLKTSSKFNKNIKVKEFLGRRELQVGNLQQSGGLVERIWEKAIKAVTSYKLRVKSVLILGLGAGSAVKIINRYFPNAKSTGVEIDPEIIKIAKKYFNIGNYKNLQIKTADAFKFIRQDKNKYNMVLVDLYLGQTIPQQSENEEFIRDVKKILQKNGTVIFNRLRGKNREKELNNFQKLLAKQFKNVETVNPLINKLFICW